MSRTAKFIKLDVEIHRVQQALEAQPKSKELKSDLDELLKSRATLLAETERAMRNRLNNPPG